MTHSKANKISLHFVVALAAIIASAVLLTVNAQTAKEWKAIESDINLFIANDLGRNGYYQQKPIAEKMGEMAEEIGPEAIIATGDVHHFEGVASVDDPLWLTNYELIYSHPELMIPWMPVLGNHEYRGNTQAVLDYSKRSRRWVMPARYYSHVFNEDGTTIRVVFIDTTPLINKYRNDSITYPDACKQDINAQLEWLEKTLKEAKEDWVIVVGHHPVYAQTSKNKSEREDLQKMLLPLFNKYNVPMYICGHIHNFQDIKKKESNTHFIVNSAGSLARKVKPTEGTVFCSSEPGFSIVTANKSNLTLHMIDSKGVILHSDTITK